MPASPSNSSTDRATFTPGQDFAASSPLPVSYTHLDVYKRQLPDNPKHFLNWQSNTKTFSGISLIQNHAYSLSATTDHPEIVSGLDVEPNFFDVLGIHPVLGRAFLPIEATDGHDSEAVSYTHLDVYKRQIYGHA